MTDNEANAAQRAIAILAIDILRDRLDGERFYEFVALVLASGFRFRDELEKEMRKRREAVH
jgi:hypothetical protein